MKKIAILMILVLCGCRSVGSSDLRPRVEPNDNKIYKLEPMVSSDNLESVYLNWLGNNKTAIITGMKDFAPVGVANSRSHRVNDAKTVFRNEVEQNISMQTGETKGRIYLTLGERKTKHSLPIKIISIVTLKIPVIVGMPSGKITETLDVKVEIKDMNGVVVKTYEQQVTNSAFVAMYYGYTSRTAYRRVALDNLRQALDGIKEKIDEDAAEINRKLR